MGQHRVCWSGDGHHREQAGGGNVAAERELSGGSAEAHAYGELGLAGSGRRRLAYLRGMVPHIWLRSRRGHAALGKTAAAASSGGSRQVAKGSRSSNR